MWNRPTAWKSFNLCISKCSNRLHLNWTYGWRHCFKLHDKSRLYKHAFTNQSSTITKDLVVSDQLLWGFHYYEPSEFYEPIHSFPCDFIILRFHCVWNLEMLVLQEGGKPELTYRKRPEARREATKNLIHLWHQARQCVPKGPKTVTFKHLVVWLCDFKPVMFPERALYSIPVQWTGEDYQCW